MDSDAPAPAPAPAEWLELFDPQTGRVVYANIVTGQCSWTRPASQIAARDPAGEWWELADDDSGVPYYYNTTTGATEWDPPPGATVVPFHALLVSSVGKRLSLAVSNRGSVAFTSDMPDPLAHKASRASLRSADGRVSRKGSLARPAPYASAPAEPSHPPAASCARLSPISDAHARLESGARDSCPSPDRRRRRTSAQQRHSQSETALETLKEALAANSCAESGCANADAEAEADEARDYFDEAHMGAMPLARPTCYDVPASAAVDTFRRSEQGPRIHSGVPSTIGRMSALDTRPGSSVMLHSHRNRSMPSIRADSRIYGMRAFASTQFAAQKRGFLRRKVPLDEMVSYTSEPLARPLMNLPRELTRDAAKCFSVMQRFMGNTDPALHDDRFDDVLWLANRGIAAPLLRDEAYCQLAKQVTGNPSAAAATRGWALMGALLYAFPPSPLLVPHLDAFAHAAPTLPLRRFLCLQLARARRAAARSAAMTAAELRLVLAVPARPLVFGAALEEIMADPGLVGATGVPTILEHLTTQIVRLGGDRTEGLFRVPADADAVTMARLRLEAGCLDTPRDGDPNIPASLLKEWLRDLAEPLVPEALYDVCVAAPSNATAVLSRMPPESLRVLKFLLAFLAELLRPDVQVHTKMDASNLALIFGPTLLRNPASDLRDAFATSSAEQRFVLTLLESVSQSS
ncbi:hypothetical protein LPJ61_002295 [Coemansia biformis]|uniref:RhoGAP-domain-containing protein n=1 Tax=Coemansia biformis TaxID=1286918 RepID=A0A9W7YED1_9FUNG|nr:hypothetical protein LPJ61_002295 [Coemansia biformis]